MQTLCALRIGLLPDWPGVSDRNAMEAQWDPFFGMLPRCCYYCNYNLNYRHFLTRCEGAGTSNSLLERRHEHVVRLDEEELPTAAFIFMKVTVLEEPSDRPRLRTYCYQLIAATTTLGVASCPRHPCLSPNPLRLFQSSPAQSWRCDSFQRTPPSPSTRPVPPTVTIPITYQLPSHLTHHSPATHHHATASQPIAIAIR